MNNWRQHISTGVALIVIVAFVALFRSPDVRDRISVSSAGDPSYSRPAQTHNSLPYTSNGMRVYSETRGDKTVLLLDLPNEKGIVIASTPRTNDTTRNGTFGGVTLSASGRYLTYGLTFWEWGSYSVYDTQTQKVVLTLPMGDGAFDTSEKYFYTCYYAGIDGSRDAKVYGVPGFKPILDLYDTYPDLDHGQGDKPGYTAVQCGEEENLHLIVFEFGYYDHMEGDKTIISVKRRFTFSTVDGELKELPI